MSRLTRLSALALLLFAAGCAALRPAPPERDAALRLAQGLAAFDAGQYNEAFDQLAWVYAHCPGRQAGLEAAISMAALELDPRHPSGRPAVGAQLLASVILDPTTPDWVRQIARTTYLISLGLGAPPAPSPPAADTPPTEGDEPPAEPVTPPTEGDAPPAEPVTPPTEGDAPPAEPVTPPAEPAATLPRQDASYAGFAFGCGPVLRDVGPAPSELPTLPGPSLAAMLTETEAERDALAAQTATLLEELTRLRRELTETRAELERIRRTLRP
jgi:hypothetical protein